MEDLAARYADRAVRSVFIYTREAHPGENLPPLTSMGDKRAHAKTFKDQCKLERKLLLDDLEGTAHHAYGLLPNMTWIIGRGGFIHYKASWTAVEDIEDALKGAIDYQANRATRQLVPFYSERAASYTRDRERLHQGLVRAGPQAVADFERAMKKNAPKKPPPADMPPPSAGHFYKPED